MGRSETLFRKAEAIKVLCGSRVALIVFDCDGGAVKHWPKEPEAVRATIEAYRMFVAKGKKRIRATVDPDPPRPSEGDFSFLDTAMAQKLQSIDSKIQTLRTTTTSSSSIITSSSSSDWFALAEQSGVDFMDYAADLDLPPFESYPISDPPSPQESPADPPSFGGGGTTATTATTCSSSLATNWLLEAAQSGLDFMDFTAGLDLPPFESYLVAPLPPPQESPADPLSYGGSCGNTATTAMANSLPSLTRDCFLEAAQLGLDFMDYTADLDLLPFESHLVDARPPPQESPGDPPSFGGGTTEMTAVASSSSSLTTDLFEAAQSAPDFMDYPDLPSFSAGTPPRESPATTSSSSGSGWNNASAAAATHASESEIIVLDDDSDDGDLCDPPFMETIVLPGNSPLLIFGENDDVYVHVEDREDINVDLEEREDVRVHVEEGEEGVHLDSPIFWTNLEDGFSYADFGLMTTSDYDADF